MSPTPTIRIRRLNDRPPRGAGDFVLYWMTAFRRTHYNFSLQRAVEWCGKLQKPLVVLEALRGGYPWASDRLHRFVLQGMAAQRARLRDLPVLYYPYVEPHAGHGRGLLAALAQRACAIVADDFPCFFLPRMIEAAAARVATTLEAVDSNGLLPLRAANETFATAHAFRRFLQRTLPAHLEHFPLENPLAVANLPRLPALPEEIARRWPAASEELLCATDEALRTLPIDHTVRAAAFDGGEPAAQQLLREFLDQRLARYAEGRNHPDDNAASGFSPYLHFGHLAAHEVFLRLAQQENWSAERLAARATGSREGWWGMSAAAESFLDELITWRELGFNMCWREANYDAYDSLPAWSQATLAKHARDRRPHIYSLDELEAARTHDPLWNAAQRQLVREGRLHNYLRMVWGKKVVEWSETPQQALAVLIHLNNKYAVDGRNPNSYSGIFWVLGRYDRPWGPERPIFGTVRYMSSDNTRRKLRLTNYLQRYGE